MTFLRVALTFLINYCVLFGVTQWLIQGRSLSAGDAGLVMVPMSILATVISVPFARRNMVRSALLAASAAALLGSCGLLLFDSSSPLWLITLMLMIFGVLSGLGMIGNQAALYRQAPTEQLGVAAGLMRTFMYSGAILSSSIIALGLGNRATDDGLHIMAVSLAGLGILLSVLTVMGIKTLSSSSVSS
jgi:hypothetical protein